MIIIESADEINANDIKVKLNKQLSKKAEPQGLELTMTLGMIECEYVENFRELMEKVDKSLYEAKS